MNRLGKAVCFTAAVLIAAVPVAAETVAQNGQGQAVVTVLPQQDREMPVHITLRDLQVKLNKKDSNATSWIPLRGVNDKLEVVVLIDGGARPTISQQLPYVADFIRKLPANAKVAVGYMMNGRAVLTAPLSTDHEEAIRGLRMPSGPAGISGSPYFCLSDLAKHWPDSDPMARREVLMITDGVDYYEPRYDPNDPYVQSAINDSVRAGLVVYSIFWHNRGGRVMDSDDSFGGQSLLLEVSEATGGYSYWLGTTDPVSFQPYLDNLAWRLKNQYRLSFTSNLKQKPEIQSMALKIGGPAAKVDAPKRVFVKPAVAD